MSCCAAVMIEARHGWGSGGEHGSSGEGEAVHMHSHYWCLGLGVECGQGEVWSCSADLSALVGLMEEVSATRVLRLCQGVGI